MAELRGRRHAPTTECCRPTSNMMSKHVNVNGRRVGRKRKRKFGGVLSKAQKKINEANNEIDNLVGTRTRMMLSKLKKVEELPSVDSDRLIDDGMNDAIEYESEA